MHGRLALVLPRDAILARHICCRRVSVRPSVTSRHCTKTAKRRITQTTPYDSPWTLVFWRQKSGRNSNGVSPYGAPNRGGVGSNWRFSTSNFRKPITCHKHTQTEAVLVRRPTLVSALFSGRLFVLSIAVL